jgi:hypothetical protein
VNGSFCQENPACCEIIRESGKVILVGEKVFLSDIVDF